MFPKAPFHTSIDVNMATQNNRYAQLSAMGADSMRGEYTNILLGVDQDTFAARKLNFDEAEDHTLV
jgi:hypothetical protein